MTRPWFVAAALSTAGALAACSATESPPEAQTTPKFSTPAGAASTPAAPPSAPESGTASVAASGSPGAGAQPSRPLYCGRIVSLSASNKKLTFEALQSYDKAEDTPDPVGAREENKKSFTVPVKNDLAVRDAKATKVYRERDLGYRLSVVEGFTKAPTQRAYIILEDGAAAFITVNRDTKDGSEYTDGCYVGKGVDGN